MQEQAKIHWQISLHTFWGPKPDSRLNRSNVEKREGRGIGREALKQAVYVLLCLSCSSSSYSVLPLHLPLSLSLLLPPSFIALIAVGSAHFAVFLAWHCFASGHFCDCHRHFHRCKYLHLHLVTLPPCLLSPSSPTTLLSDPLYFLPATGLSCFRQGNWLDFWL